MDLGPAKVRSITELSSHTNVDLHFGKRNSTIAGEGPEDSTSAELRADHAGAESDEQDKKETKCTASLLGDLAEELCKRHASVARCELVEVLDGKHETDQVGDTSAECDRQGDSNGKRSILRRLNLG